MRGAGWSFVATKGRKPQRMGVRAEGGAVAPRADGPPVTDGPPRPRRRPKGFDVEVAEPTAPLDLAPPTSGECRARIEYISPDGKEHIRDLAGQITVGRHTDNDIQLLDPEVSKHHLSIEELGGAFVLRDLGSANGTLVNGEQQSTMNLKTGDVIEVGNTRLRFVALDAAGPRTGPTPSFVSREPDDFFERTGPITGEIDPFEQMLSGSHARNAAGPPAGKSEPERTTVTLVPGFGPDPETNVFAMPMAEDFQRAADIADERQLRRDYERLRVAFDLSLEVGLRTDLGALGNTILERIKQVLPADTAVIMLMGDGGELVPLASAVDEYAHQDGEVRIPRAIVDQVVSSKEGLLTSDAQADAQLRASHTVVGQQISSALCVPLLVQDEVRGVIHLSSSSAAGAYEERDLALLRAIAQPAALAVANARLVQKVEEDAHARATLSRFLSPALVDSVVEQRLSIGVGGDKVQCSVLFSDIRGFTEMSDGAAPEQVVSMLNEYFEAMVDVVFEFGGVLDKFIGDGMMAVWGTPYQSDDDPLRAVRAAARMREVLDTVVNRQRQARGDPPLTAGYGIATGEVISGAMGSQRRLDFTVIGDTVNLASRLCGKAHPGQVLVCETTQALCGDEQPLLALDPLQVKGVARPVPVYEVPRPR